MKQLVLPIFGMITFFYASMVLCCPTCIGLPKKGSRPFFERRGIRYVMRETSEGENKSKGKKQLQKSDLEQEKKG